MITKIYQSHNFSSLFMIVIMFCCALAVFSLPGGWSNAEDKMPPTGIINETDNSSNIKSSFLFGGIVEPGETLSILLQPGETVKKFFVNEGEVVKEDQILVQLSSDSLTNSKFDLLQKQSQLQQEREQIDAAALEIKMKKKQLTQVNKEIQAESRLTSEVDGYVSTVSKQLTNQKELVANELEILQFKFAKMQLREKQYQVLDDIIALQLTDLQKRINSLLIKAPFPGKVTFLSPFTFRTPPGAVVCELWGNRSFRVRGRIMQHQIDQILIGEDVEISLDFSEYPPLTGKVLMIQQSKIVQNEKNGYPTFDVIVEVVSKGQWIEPGMMVSMKKTTK